MIAYGQEVAAKLNEIENRDAILIELRKQLAAAASEYRREAEALTTAAAAAAKKLAALTERHINDLAMKARFAVEDRGRRRIRSSGRRTVGMSSTARIATNPGEPLKPLDQIASGGEMSRVLLALKVSVEEGAARAGKGRKTLLPRTLVFDEIDIGIGGRAAEAVGQKLKLLSRSQQVLCVTHLPQIAAFAGQHFVVEKSRGEGPDTNRHTQAGTRRAHRGSGPDVERSKTF